MTRTAQPRILLIEDDVRLRALLARLFERESFVVDACGTLRHAESLMRERPPDLVVLDLMLPDGHGLDVCRAWRAAGRDVPIVMLTARGDDTDRIVGLELGADDYLPKPCNPRELVARVRAVLRRRAPPSPVGAPDADGAPIRFGSFELHPGTRELRRDGARVPLTTAEFAVLLALVRHAGRTLSRDELVKLARGRDAAPFERSIDIQISRLRRAIEDDPSVPRFLQTVWGAGYVFVPDAAAR